LQGGRILGFKAVLSSASLANQAAKAYTSLFASTLMIFKSFFSSAANLILRYRSCFSPIKKHTKEGGSVENVLLGGVGGYRTHVLNNSNNNFTLLNGKGYGYNPRLVPNLVPSTVTL